VRSIAADPDELDELDELDDLAGRARGHVLRELGLTVARGAPGELEGTAPVVPEMWVPGTDVLRSSIIATWADTLTGLLAVDVVGPRVPVTLQLDVNLYAPPRGVTRVHATARRAKAGRAVFVAVVDIVDEIGTPLGTSTGLFMVAPDPDVRMPDGHDPVALLADPGDPLRVPLAERAGCERPSPGVAVLPRRDDGLNASGTVNGGLLALVIEEAALGAVPGTTLSMMALRFLRAVRVGPAVARAVAHGGVTEVTVHDAGRSDAGRADGGAVTVQATTRSFEVSPTG
jgi:acyl-coenzyme A thioesterase PaaI-like protein